MTDETTSDRYLSAERCAAFIDAVVAIAMTLLILPLMEAVSDAGAEGGSAGRWFGDHQEQLTSFLVSFVMIALFWMIHHRLFRRISAVPTGLMWLVSAWLLTIVWLPVATSMSGQFSDAEGLVRVVYIGSLFAVCAVSFVIRLYVRRHPEISSAAPSATRGDLAVDLSMMIMFAIALGVTLLFPVLGYWPLLLMFLTGAVQSLIRRAWR
ncbi:TMEM175 family protein [Microbacterium telephonicum]|uniref:Putative membrane protein n=1 Tax=Microbacterium telephonicum TaxID=1714841 RepID=A0A498CIL5_9MICO|nr:TMEM175 family protein [Microbacterium telephonicum]RLK52171.1 putative membrane protein [Microbacterium telephonicum]